ncbi:hypothetical protein CTRI78_v002132 [Colletotrichum trifolii]|uniref:Lysine-specific metallo-endopeptidase domain-containing protein n=1 Tax=Colletotrichum trifolii TaxID=5466 RepID=A0A4R8RSH9_COLTR|nr:hypothetical protein CTRI78_v002132 [Colletotrichum trifolii]
MQFLAVFRPLLISLLVCQTQGLITPRGFRFKEPKDGREGGCSAEDIAIIRTELKVVKEAAETAAGNVAGSPFFYAFQKPGNDLFRGKDLAEAARQFYLRMAQLADESYRGNDFRIECRPEECRLRSRDTVAVMTESVLRQFFPPSMWVKKPSDPVLAFCEPFFTGSSGVSTEQRLKELKQDVERLRNGEIRSLAGTSVNMGKVADTRSKVVMHELSHTNFVAEPITDVVRPKASVKKAMLDYMYDVYDCYQLAGGMWKSGSGWMGDQKKGARRAAMNAENWALVGMGTYFAKQLGVEKISIPGAVDGHWGRTPN